MNAGRHGVGSGYYRRVGKRVFDLAFSAVALVALAPVLAVVASVVRLRLGAPVLFSQERPGLGGKPFRLVKFRSMTDARDAAGQLLPDADRLPAFGRFLRATSLDELPELFNVLAGHMSIVGPRPLLMQYLPLYSPTQARRHDVRPGLTGLAQVRGRNALTWDEKFAADIEYVDRLAFGLDLKIIALTIGHVLSPRGISAPGDATMPPFTGNSKEGGQ